MNQEAHTLQGSGSSHGVEIKRTSKTIALPSGGKLEIGRYYHSSPAYYLNGTIDEVRIYNRSLSAAEIKMQYNSSKYYPFAGNVSASLDIATSYDTQLFGDGQYWYIANASATQNYSGIEGLLPFEIQITMVNITADAGGPYFANSTVMITGNVSSGALIFANQSVTVQIKNSTYVFNATTVTSDASGNCVAKLFINSSNTTADPFEVFANSTRSGVSGSSTYPLSVKAQTVLQMITCTSNSTACSFQTYPVSGWVMDSATGGLTSSGTIKLSVKETGDTYSTTFGGGYFSITPSFCLSPGVVYSFVLSIEGGGRQGFMTYRRAGKA